MAKHSFKELIMDFIITIKFAKDNVFDLYLNDEWVASRGHYENILDEAKKLIEDSLINK